MLYSIGTQTFNDIRKYGLTYVDKTAYVYKLAHEGKSYFLGRPRRFGKSLLISTMQAYFEGRKELFEGLAIEKLEKEWLKYPVLEFEFNGGSYKTSVGLEDDLSWQLSEYENIYGRDPEIKTLGVRFKRLITAAARQTGLGVVVLIDEYDKPILDAFDTPQENKNKECLRDFYSALKGVDKYLRFVFFTGVTKFSQVSVFSGFNQLDDLSSSSAFDAICGITEEELYTVFAEPIEKLAQKRNCSVDEIKQRLKEQYDGYHFSEEMLDVYNPYSVIKALKDGQIGNYWYSTATPSYLVRLLENTNENIEDMIGQYYSAGLFKDYKADAEQPLPMIYQSGYLTIKDYDPEDESYLLDFPNKEVRLSFGLLLSATYFKKKITETDVIARKLMGCLRKGNLEGFIKEMKAYLAGIPYSAYDLEEGKVTEKYFQFIFFVTMQFVGGSRVSIEEESSRGRADFVIEFKDYIYIFEFKMGGTVEAALKQIDDKGYAEKYATGPKKVVKVGVVFSAEKRNIEEWGNEPADF